MAHVREQVEAAFASTVTGLATTGANVFRERTNAIPQDRLPALVLEGSEELPEYTTRDAMERVLVLTVGIVLRGDEGSIKTASNAIAVEVELAIVGAPDLGLGTNLVKWARLSGTSTVVSAEAEQPTMSMLLEFTIEYRSALADPETLIA